MLPLWEDAPSSVIVTRSTGADETDSLVRLFEDVAAKEGWQPSGALRSWLNRSVYFRLYKGGILTGGLQLVLPDGSVTLPYQSVWPEMPVPLHTAHVAVLALLEEHRGQGMLFWHLAIEMWRHCVGHGIMTVFIEVTPRVLPLYQRLGWPLVIQGELRTHWGEPCYLCSLGIPEVAEAILRRAEHSNYYRQIIAQAFRVEMLVSPSDKMGIAGPAVPVVAW